MTLAEQRRKAADEAYEDYDFRARVEDQDPWTYTDSGRMWRNVYFDVGLHDSAVGKFHILFEEDSAEIKGVW